MCGDAIRIDHCWRLFSQSSIRLNRLTTLKLCKPDIVLTVNRQLSAPLPALLRPPEVEKSSHEAEVSRAIAGNLGYRLVKVGQ